MPRADPKPAITAQGLTRTFGVFREADSGEGVVFDPIFTKDTPLPAAGEPPLAVVRRYRARHNIGHFRFVECGRVQQGRPDGDVTPWDEVRFPFAPHLRERELPGQPVERQADEGPEVEERYVCLPTGAVEVTVRDLSDGFARCYQLGRAG